MGGGGWFGQGEVGEGRLHLSALRGERNGPHVVGLGRVGGQRGVA